MTDIFFSYSSADRERVRPIRDALVAQGFEVFWDQQVPAGTDWDTWIRQHLADSKCAMVFWSATSIRSRNVRHEATVASQQDKLITVLLEPLTAQQFPMGLYTQQAANLSEWNCDVGHDEWRKLQREFEAKLMPPWVRRQIDELEAELVGARARCEKAERRDRILQAQITKEAETQQDLKQERDKALDEVAALKTTYEESTKALAEAQQAWTWDRNKAVAEVSALKTSVDELSKARADAEARAVELSQRLTKVRQSKAQETARSIAAAFSPFVIVAALATAGFWTYQLIWSAPQPTLAITSDSTADAETKLKAAEIEQQRLQEEVQGQAKAATELQTKLQAAQAEQQQQARAVADADSKRKAAEAEQQRLKEEVQGQAKATAYVETKLKAAEAELQRQAEAAGDAEAKRKAAEAEQQRLREEVQRQAKAAADAEAKRKAAEAEQQRQAAARVQSTPAATNKQFEIRRDMEARATTRDRRALGAVLVRSMDECEQKCTQAASCNAFTLSKTAFITAEHQCYLYSDAELVPNSGFDSGVRK